MRTQRRCSKAGLVPWMRSSKTSAKNLTKENIASAAHVLSDNALRDCRRELFVRATKAIQEHRAWNNGWGCCASHTGLRPQRVDTTQSDKLNCPQCCELFDYDSEIIPNPPGAHVPERSCKQKLWGLCAQDRLLSQCLHGARNMYFYLRSLRLKQKLPLLIGLKCRGQEELYLVAGFVGEGQTALVCALLVDEEERCLVFRISASVGHRMIL